MPHNQDSLAPSLLRHYTSVSELCNEPWYTDAPYSTVRRLELPSPSSLTPNSIVLLGGVAPRYAEEGGIFLVDRGLDTLPVLPNTDSQGNTRSSASIRIVPKHRSSAPKVTLPHRASWGIDRVSCFGQGCGDLALVCVEWLLAYLDPGLIGLLAQRAARNMNCCAHPTDETPHPECASFMLYCSPSEQA